MPFITLGIPGLVLVRYPPELANPLVDTRLLSPSPLSPIKLSTRGPSTLFTLGIWSLFRSRSSLSFNHQSISSFGVKPLLPLVANPLMHTSPQIPMLLPCSSLCWPWSPCLRWWSRSSCPWCWFWSSCLRWWSRSSCPGC